MKTKDPSAPRIHLLPLLVLAGLWVTPASQQVLAAVPAPAYPMGERAIDIGNRLELFVDRHLIERLEGTSLKMHEPKMAGVALRFDAAWDGACTGYITVLPDAGLFRMYYVGLPMENNDEEAYSYPCYAESRDGINWTKPDLNLVEFKGSKKNNILFLPSKEEPFAVNFAPFIDTRPGTPKEERFKAVGGSHRKGLFALVSSDGIRWQKWREKPIFTAGAFDSQNVAFWSELENCYVLYFRVFSESWSQKSSSPFTGYRTISKSTSPDLINWSEPKRMSFGNTVAEHLYTQSTHPYFRAPHIYISLPMRFVPHHRSLTREQFAALGVVPAYANIRHNGMDIPSEVSDSVLLTSRGGYRYDRTFMEAFIRPGPELGDWVSRNGMNATGIVPTGPAEMSLYHQGHYAQASAHLKRYTLRTDGLASVNAPYSGGECVTKPLKITGEKLVINYATSAPGGIRVELQEADGEPIPEFTLLEANELVGDSIEGAVTWKLGGDLKALTGKTVRIRFVMKDADIYSLRFR